MDKRRQSDSREVWDFTQQPAHAQAVPHGARGKGRLGTEELARLPLDDTVPSTALDDSQLFAEGAKLDRFIVIEHVGRGGMGDVVSAYDPELDRRVAIKVLRLDVWGDSAASGRRHLTREAQAMARLSHPNVVTVHEVGAVGDRLFIAMEYVDGGTLADWLRSEPRPWSSVVASFIEAAQGLAAAHQAGLIHRDFKPRNVLVGIDGRVRVTDFGLASISSSAEECATLDGIESKPFPRVRLLDSTVPTERGAVVGTPAYMSPEQFADAHIDARSDQFSFCVSLYEALYRKRPFAGKKVGELRDNVARGLLDDSAVETTVPLWLREVILRGLSGKPDERYPSMDELIAALRADPDAKRRRHLAVGAAALTIAGAAALLTLFLGGSSSSEQRCDRSRTALEQVWNPDAEAGIERAFTSTKKSYADFSFKRVKKLLDRRGQAWVEMRTDACEAHHIRHEQSAQLFDLRMRCLSERLDETQALVTLFAKGPDLQILHHSIKLASRLPSVAVCADRVALSSHAPAPTDPLRQSEVKDLQRKLLEIEALAVAGRYQEGLERVAMAVAAAHALGYKPFLAEALYLRGKLERQAGRAADAERTHHEAARVAAEGKDDILVAKAEAEQVLIAGYDLHQHERALVLMKSAEVSAARADDPLVDAMLAHNSAIVLAEMGRYQEAKQRLDEALSIRRKVLGPEHPELGWLLNSIGGLLARQGDHKGARETYGRALEVSERTLGSDHPDVAITLANLANALVETGDLERADRSYQRALEILESTHGSGHPQVAWVLNELGLLAQERGLLADARAHLERAVVVLTAAHGAKAPDLTFSLVNLGGIALLEKRYRVALDYCRRAAQIREANGPADHPYNIYHLDCIGRAELGQGHPSLAIAPLENAVQIMKASAASPTDLAATRLQLARALWSARRDRKRALLLATASRETYAASPKQSAAELAEVETWLAARGQ